MPTSGRALRLGKFPRRPIAPTSQLGISPVAESEHERPARSSAPTWPSPRSVASWAPTWRRSPPPRARPWLRWEPASSVPVLLARRRAVPSSERRAPVGGHGASWPSRATVGRAPGRRTLGPVTRIGGGRVPSPSVRQHRPPWRRGVEVRQASPRIALRATTEAVSGAPNWGIPQLPRRSSLAALSSVPAGATSQVGKSPLAQQGRHASADPAVASRSVASSWCTPASERIRFAQFGSLSGLSPAVPGRTSIEAPPIRLADSAERVPDTGMGIAATGTGIARPPHWELHNRAGRLPEARLSLTPRRTSSTIEAPSLVSWRPSFTQSGRCSPTGGGAFLSSGDRTPRLVVPSHRPVAPSLGRCRR
jgi:hypothetical protein